MPTFNPSTVATASAGLVTSAWLNANYKTAIDDLRTQLGTGTSATITSFSGSGVGAGTRPPTARRYGDRVILSGTIADSNSTLASGTIATLPAGYWPGTADAGSWVCSGDGTTFGKISVATNGTVTLALIGGTTPTTIALDGISFLGA